MPDDCSESERRCFFNSAGPQRHPRVARAPPPSRADALRTSQLLAGASGLDAELEAHDKQQNSPRKLVELELPRHANIWPEARK